MAYLGNNLQVAYPSYRVIDDISSQFNSSLKTFALKIAGSTPVPFPVNPQQCLISVNSVIQKPDSTGASGFTLTGSNIVFATAPTTGWSFFGTVLAGADYVNIGANFPSGTAAVPSITFDQSSGTGLYLASTNVLGIATSGVQQLTVDSSGNVSVTGALSTASTNTAASFIPTSSTVPTNGVYLPAANSVAISTNSSQRLVIDASGNVNIDSNTLYVDAINNRVGVGTSSPEAGCLLTLQESASLGAAIALRNRNSTQAWRVAVDAATVDDKSLAFIDNSTSTVRMALTDTGRLGIGTTSPAGLLDVRSATTWIGDGTIDAFLQFNQSATAANRWHIGTGSSNALIFYKGTYGTGSETARIDSSGNLLVGGTNNSLNARVVAENASGNQIASRYTGVATYYFNTTSSGDFEINKDGAGRLRIDSSGRVGIGTTSPQSVLHVKGGDIVLETADPGTRLIRTSFAGGAIQLGGSSTTTDRGLRFGLVGGALTFSEFGRFDDSGRLLVGTSTARSNFFNGANSGLFQVEGLAGASQRGLISATNNSTSNDPPWVILNKSASNAIGSNTLVANNDDLGVLGFQGNDGSDFVVAGQISCSVDGTPGANDMPGRLVFSTTASGAASPTERMRITNNGSMIATNTGSYVYTDRYAIESSNGTAPALSIYNKRNVAGDQCVYLRMGVNTNGTSSTYMLGDTDSTGVRFYIYGNGNIQNVNNSYGAISDIKLKENIVDANSQWDDLKSFQVRKYNFKEGQTHTQIGLVAQEAELVSPGLVYETPDRDSDGNDLGTVTKGINYSVLYMKAIKALQEAMERIEALEADVAQLKGA